MNVLLEHSAAKLTVRKSHFLAEIFPVTTQSQVRSLLKAQKQKYADACHVVHAFVLGAHAEIMGMSDDGEPSGTAGRPVLDVLKGFCCTNILLTVARRFGGILLGTGGLVKAYGQSAKLVLKGARTEEFVERSRFELCLSYEQYEVCKRLFKEFNITQLSGRFSERVNVTGLIETRLKAEFEKETARYINIKKRLL